MNRRLLDTLQFCNVSGSIFQKMVAGATENVLLSEKATKGLQESNIMKISIQNAASQQNSAHPMLMYVKSIDIIMHSKRVVVKSRSTTPASVTARALSRLCCTFREFTEHFRAVRPRQR